MPRRSVQFVRLVLAIAVLSDPHPSHAFKPVPASTDVCRQSLVDLVATKLRDHNLVPATVSEMVDMTILEIGPNRRRGPEFVEIRCSNDLRNVRLSFTGRYPDETGTLLATEIAASLTSENDGDWPAKLVRKCLSIKDNATLFHEIGPPIAINDHGVELQCRSVKWDRADPYAPVSLQIDIRNGGGRRANRS